MAMWGRLFPGGFSPAGKEWNVEPLNRQKRQNAHRIVNRHSVWQKIWGMI